MPSHSHHHNQQHQQQQHYKPLLEVPTALPAEENERENLWSWQRLRVYRKPSFFVATAVLSVVTLLLLLLLCTVWWNTDGTISGNAFHQHDSFLTPEEYASSWWQTTVAEDGQACFTALDCGAGRWCAFPSMHNMSIRVCCDEALHLGLGETGDPDSAWLTVCTGASVGEACGSHHGLCASGYCVHGKCATQGLAAGRKCPDHGHCASGACGRWDYNTTRAATQYCCPTAHVWTRSDDTTSLPFAIHFCHGTATAGAPCVVGQELCEEGTFCNNQGVCAKPN